MTTIAIVPEHVGNGTTWRALAGEKESTGRTAGEALDALTTQLSEDEISTLVIVQRLRPDRFFTAEQRQRLGTLMERWRAERDGKNIRPAAERAELEVLVEAELEGATRRAEAVLDELS
jgi:hypothetical protein